MKGLSIAKIYALEQERRRQNKAVKEHQLKTLYWECTVRCNLSCRHCGTYCRVLDDLSDMPIDDFTHQLDNIAQANDPSSIMVMLVGGEPLLRPDIVDCGRAISSRGFRWGIVTNGVLMTPDLFAALKSVGLKRVVVAFDGLEYEHDWLCGVHGAYSQMNEALSFICAEKDVDCEVTTCVNQRNFDYLSQIRLHLYQTGVRQWRIYTAFPAGKAANDKELQLDTYQFRQLMAFIESEREDKSMDVAFSCEGFLGQYEGRVRDGFYMCQAGISIGSIRINGDIAGCPSVNHKYSQGSIYEGDEFMEIWNTCFDPYRNREWMHTGICTHCKVFRYCRGNGMHLRTPEGDIINCNFDRLNPGR